jgi:hypothetical protein
MQIHLLLTSNITEPRNPCYGERLSTVDLLVLNKHLSFTKILFTLITKTRYVNEEVNGTETFLSDSFSWWNSS